MGNIRLSYGFDQASEVLKIIEENHYYPFGLKHTRYNTGEKKYQPDEQNPELMKLQAIPAGEQSLFKYKYNAQEWQDELGLNMTAMDFRQYDNAIGRFVSIDGFAEIYQDLTPYRFGFNNPVFWSDPTGLIEENDLAYCPTCPNTPQFKPLIDDPNTEYIYDPATNQAGEVLKEVVVAKNNSNKSFNNAPGLFYGFGNQLNYFGNNSVPTRAKFSGSTPGTSLASQYFRSTSWANKKVPTWMFKKLPKRIGGAPFRANTFGSLAGRATPVAGRLFVGSAVVMSVYNVSTAENKSRAVAQEAGGWIGAWGGAKLGASIGASFGSIVPGVGTAIGGFVGGVIGGGIGYMVGSQAGEEIYDETTDDD